MDRTEQFTTRWVKAQPGLWAFILSLEPDFHRAEDILQRVALAAVQKFGEYDTSRPFIAWAIGIARYEVLNDRSHRRRDRLVFSDDIADLIAQTHVEMNDELTTMREHLAHCIAKLNDKARTTVELCYGGRQKLDAIAAHMGMTPVAVRVLLHRCRLAVRECIERRIARSELRS